MVKYNCVNGPINNLYIICGEITQYEKSKSSINNHQHYIIYLVSDSAESFSQFESWECDRTYRIAAAVCIWIIDAKNSSASGKMAELQW